MREYSLINRKIFFQDNMIVIFGELVVWIYKDGTWTSKGTSMNVIFDFVPMICGAKTVSKIPNWVEFKILEKFPGFDFTKK